MEKKEITLDSFSGGGDFENVISLGHSCMTAYACSQFGWRSFSSPFDWEISNFRGVLQLIENDFEDWLCYENLREYNNCPRQFVDMKYDILYPHDADWSWEEEFTLIYEKYARRVQRFLEATGRKTLFLRLVKDKEEMEFIQQNIDWILSIIRKKNEKNDIFFIYNREWGIKEQSRFWGINLNKVQSNLVEARLQFETNPKLISAIESNVSIRNKEQNYFKGLEMQNKKLEIFYHRYKLINALENKICVSGEIGKSAIWGLGDIGKRIYDKIKNTAEIVFFVDEVLGEIQYDNIPIYSFYKIPQEIVESVDMFIITPIQDLKKIKSKILEILPRVQVIGTDEFIDIYMG